MEGPRDAKKGPPLGEDHQATLKPITYNNESGSTQVNKFNIDHSKNGRAKCKECGNKITKGELRIGKYVPFKAIYITQYYHTLCAFKSFTRACLVTNVITNINELDGVNLISIADKSSIEDLINHANANRTTKAPHPPTTWPYFRVVNRYISIHQGGFSKKVDIITSGFSPKIARGVCR